VNAENEFLAINVLKTEQNKEFFVKIILQRRIIGTIIYRFPYIFIRFVLRMNHHEQRAAHRHVGTRTRIDISLINICLMIASSKFKNSSSVYLLKVEKVSTSYIFVLMKSGFTRIGQ